ncbi:MAG: Transcriptional regulator, GntR family [uncultured Solirubrobacteraceae bacterium]|uniref:Transcriptional regulator, GntR family n=1 Tax=uncultured Solirubrobacteraceae bacterium TaxID=1162706 RepID=A0A6J4RMK2_9ACTN|nr:MAG: Transcriptional regulator, GntR family [uncultured Solirubrobacteraceae bacterium]
MSVKPFSFAVTYAVGMTDNGAAIRVLANEHTFEPVATPRIADIIAERLARAIREGVLQPGDRLPTEQQLAREFGVGRTSVREGLQKLRAYGLVESRKGLGAFVTAPSFEDPLADFARWAARDPAGIEKLLEARVALETVAAGLAAARASEQDLALLEERHLAHEKATEARDVAHMVGTDEAFHEQIFAAAGNQIVSRLYELLTPELTDFRRKTLALPWAATRSAHGHAAIVDGIRRHDPPAARHAMADHLLVLYEEVHESVGSEGATARELKLAPRNTLV